MNDPLSDDMIAERLKRAGLRPTRQRIALGKLLFGGCDRHVTAEALHDEAASDALPVSLATVYNTLHQFTEAGLLHAVATEGTRTYFDTNTTIHSHYYIEADDTLLDIEQAAAPVVQLQPAPKGMAIARVDVLVRLVKKDDASR